MLWAGLLCVIVVFPGHTHLLFKSQRELGRIESTTTLQSKKGGKDQETIHSSKTEFLKTLI